MSDLNHLMVRLFAATELTVCAECASLGLGWRAVVEEGHCAVLSSYASKCIRIDKFFIKPYVGELLCSACMIGHSSACTLPFTTRRQCTHNRRAALPSVKCPAPFSFPSSLPFSLPPCLIMSKQLHTHTPQLDRSNVPLPTRRSNL